MKIDMKVFLYFMISIVFCRNISGQIIDSIQIMSSEWYRFYAIQNTRLNVSSFKENITEKHLIYIEGHIIADYDLKFRECNKMFIFESPDKQKYIDFLSYSTLVDQSDSCKILGCEVDQEVNLIDRSKKKIQRIKFSGSAETVEDIIWLNDNEVLLLCRLSEPQKGLRLSFEHFDFMDSKITICQQSQYYKYSRNFLDSRYGF